MLRQSFGCLLSRHCEVRESLGDLLVAENFSKGVCCVRLTFYLFHVGILRFRCIEVSVGDWLDVTQRWVELCEVQIREDLHQ